MCYYIVQVVTRERSFHFRTMDEDLVELWVSGARAATSDDRSRPDAESSDNQMSMREQELPRSPAISPAISSAISPAITPAISPAIFRNLPRSPVISRDLP